MLNSAGFVLLADFLLGRSFVIQGNKIYSSDKVSVEDKRMLLSYIFSNITLNDDIVAPKYTFAFNFLSEWMPKANKQSETFEPANLCQDKTKNRALDPVYPAWLGVLDEIRTYFKQNPDSEF